MNHGKVIAQLRQTVLEHIKATIAIKEPESLYAPIDYIMQLGGKRMRPVLTLMAAEVFGGQAKDAMNAAMAIEVFHNFSLVHDDIMDDAPLRRGKTTVHEKWDVNTGILSGDAMLILAYQFFESYEPEMFKALVSLFSTTAIEVCEGQQYDVDFETRTDVTLEEYLKMIAYKTAVLVAAAMKMGAITAGASGEDAQSIYEFGKNLGIAFQLQDDYLDAFGDAESFGKQVGGDIIENKKTVLFIKALEFSDTEQREQLLSLYSKQPDDATEKVEAVKAIFIESGAVDFTKATIANYTEKAFQALENLSISDSNKGLLEMFGTQLMNRKI
ncbi:MAG: polyprenyl synthetase family protein [Bacteroidota bacterium]